MTNWETGLPDGLRTRIVRDTDGRSYNELVRQQSCKCDLGRAVLNDPRCPVHGKPGSPEAYLYACGEELAEERRAHRVTKGLLVEAQGRPTYFGLGFVTGLAFAFFMSAVVTLL